MAASSKTICKKTNVLEAGKSMLSVVSLFFQKCISTLVALSKSSQPGWITSYLKYACTRQTAIFKNEKGTKKVY